MSEIKRKQVQGTTPAISETSGEKMFQTSLKDFLSQANNFGSRFIHDAKIRMDYLRDMKFFSDELVSMVKSGKMSFRDAANFATDFRDDILNASRLQLKDIGKAVSKNLKNIQPPLEYYCQKYALKHFQKDFTTLTHFEQNFVYLKITQSAGRGSSKWYLNPKNLSKAGRGLILVTYAISVYNIIAADDKVRAVAKEGTTLGASTAGAFSMGALGAYCGPGAIVCVPVGIFIGGVLGAFGAEIAFDQYWK